MISRGSGWSRPVLVTVFYLGLAAVGVAWASWRGQVNLWRPAAVGEPHIYGGILAGLGLGLLIVFLSHIGPRRRHLPWTVGSFVAGVLFSQLFLWSGDLTGPVIAHFTVNVLNLRHVASHDLR